MPANLKSFISVNCSQSSTKKTLISNQMAHVLENHETFTNVFFPFSAIGGNMGRSVNEDLWTQKTVACAMLMSLVRRCQCHCNSLRNLD